MKYKVKWYLVARKQMARCDALGEGYSMFLTITVCDDSNEELLRVGRMAWMGEEMGMIHA